ncbi:MAG: histidine--tRNA ligase [Rhodospirillaceae bacterium]|nr:MAG: histidine--tRNA ligase [Rhodospirillaceae bacterium]
MSSLQPVRGTHDLMFDDIRRHRHIEATAFEIAQRYGYSEIATPAFEFTEVFARTLGDTSDIVTKEMYTFETKGGESITLRPEGTAGVARAFITNGLAQQTPLKFFYRGPMFRHERPQRGRQRQFHQIGAELIGVAGPQADVEVIVLAKHILNALGVTNVTLQINSLGDAESRTAYRDVLVKFLSGRRDLLSVESRERLERNPLRVLDSKDPADRDAIAGAPKFGDHLNETSHAFFDAVKSGLTAHGVQFVVNPALVRGLDYYSHTAFEFVTDALGAQGTVLAGGRYDGLIGDMGGPVTPGIGWAAGIERLAMMLPALAPAKRPVAVIPVGPAEEQAADLLAAELRAVGFAVDVGYGGNMGKRMKRANKIAAVAAIILGEDEIKANTAAVRNLDSGEQTIVPRADLIGHLAPYR